MTRFRGWGFLIPILPLLLLAATDDDPLYRPQVDVAKDPAAWYAPDLFQRLDPPDPGDWRQAHPEEPQSFTAYVRSDPIRATRSRHTIYLVPVGPMTAEERRRIETLREFLEIYYTVPVRQRERASLGRIRSRQHEVYPGHIVTQYWTRDLMQKIVLPRLTRTGLCALGVTMQDLYPEDSWNYVFGQATLSARVGVYSLARFYPAFWGKEATPESDLVGLRRSLRTLVHETGHMFGVYHCQTYSCVMNGANHLAEADRQPLHLCPECLKRLRWNLGFDVPARYEALKTFYESHDMKEEAEWVAQRLEACRQP